MTFLKTRCRLMRALTPKDFATFGKISSIYGIRGLSFDGDDLVVEYDASRIHQAEVIAALRKAGLPAAPLQPIPAGGFDYTGEFKDFAWPVTGLSPANQKQK